MLKRVEAKRTPVTPDEFIEGIVRGWKLQYNEIPQKKSVAIIYAQWSIETGQGKAFWNFNVGNVKAKDDPNKVIEYCALTGVWEIINGKRIVLPVDNPGSFFLSFNSLEEGLAHHLEFIKTKRYKAAWQAVLDGSPAEYAHLLKVAGYYTAPEADYVKAVVIYYNQCMKKDVYEKVIEKIKQEQIDQESTREFDDSPSLPAPELAEKAEEMGPKSPHGVLDGLSKLVGKLFGRS